MWYDYECPKCKKIWEAQHVVAERLQEACSDCGEKATLMITHNRPTVSLYYEHAYPIKITDLGVGPQTDVTVHSKREHKEVLRRHEKECPAFL